MLQELSVFLNDFTYDEHIKKIKNIIDNVNMLLNDIEDNPLTKIFKEKMKKILSLLISSKNKQNVNKKYEKELSDSFYSQSNNTQFKNTITLGDICIPNVLINRGPTLASCGLLSCVHLLLSLGYSSTYFDIKDIHHLTLFVKGFMKLNDNTLCTGNSEINDVIRSFADIISAHIPLTVFYSVISTKAKYDYNFSDILKPSIFSQENDIKKRFIYDIDKLKPKYLFLDIGMWLYLIDNGISTKISIKDINYTLHAMIVNTGGHYVTVINVRNEFGLVYDNLKKFTTKIDLNRIDINSIGALLYVKT